MLSLCLSGCEEMEALTKPDYITVTVVCYVSVKATYAEYDTMPVVSALVRVRIVKAGGERVEENVDSDPNGNCKSVTATFKLYKEQNIDCYANVDLLSTEDNYPGFYFNSDRYTIKWSDIYPAIDFGGSTQRVVRLTVIGFRN